MNYIINIILSTYYWILDVILPQDCLGCKTRGKIICNNCILSIRKTERETIKDIISLYDYRDPLIKKAIWSLKYHNHFSIGTELGKLLYLERIEDISEMRLYTQGNSIYVIPVPLYNSRQKYRGYNQAEIIASSFCKNENKEILELRNDIVIKQINTQQQAKLNNRNKRLSNIKGAFIIKKPDAIKGKTIIVIDDVTTTGGTISEIIKILKKSGAKKVIGFTVAH